ncbi:MAG TPA: alpha/beta fold hydrolase, partial [Solirubrobacteraceae bacterium]|nr:alpha/beta fold hydrolase [Solirubrobacteraceae bacterium]
AARGTSLESSRRGRLVLGAVNGAWGDRLAAEGSPLAISLGFRGELPPANPTSRIAVFVHGLGETDESWQLGGDRSEPYPSRLLADHGFTPLVLRYNTGLHISQNGRALAELLDETCRAWPVRVDEVVLIGHSMGGLVGRSACHYATELGFGWVEQVRHVFSLGSPFNGADLEKATNVVTWALGALPETRALATALNHRSAGVKDLRYGNLTDACWYDRDPDALLQDHRCEIPWLEHAQHTFISAELFGSAEHPVGRVFGDLLVRTPSAWAGGLHGEHTEFLIDSSHSIGPANHFTLLNHPDVYDKIREQLLRGRELLPGASPPKELAAATRRGQACVASMPRRSPSSSRRSVMST